MEGKCLTSETSQERRLYKEEDFAESIEKLHMYSARCRDWCLACVDLLGGGSAYAKLGNW